MPRSLCTVALVVFFLSAAPASLSRPPYKKALVDHYGPALPARLHSCNVCHLPEKPGKEETERPHNAFGLRLKSLITARKKVDIPSLLDEIADEDSDRDGTANILEMLSGHWPGDPHDKPTAAELVDARKKLADWQGARKLARGWKPFHPVTRPAVPVTAHQARTPIDRFLAAEQAKQGLEPRPEAPRHVLLRRVYLDLIGLPPTPEEVRAFYEDSSPDAYEKVVDRLLASPRYGERWGRHWMDVWRYSDWAGYGSEVRDSHKHIWHWRDWIIESLNADKGYDRMVLEMLAADEVSPGDESSLRATGFLVRNWYLFNRNVWLERTVEHTSKAFLGITLNCARCHDHFFDAISQKEYYAFRAIFEPHLVRTDRVPGQPDLSKDGLARVYDGQLTVPTYLFNRGDEASPDKSAVILPGVPSLLGGELNITPVTLPPASYQPDRRDFVVADLRATQRQALATVEQARERAGRNSLSALPPLLPTSTWIRLGNAGQIQRVFHEEEIAGLAVQAARARMEALEAVLAVEKLEGEGKVNSPTWKEASLLANSRQRQEGLLEARRLLAVAEIESWLTPGPRKAATVAKVTAARTRLMQAEMQAKAAPTPNFTRRTLATYPVTSTGRRLGLARWIASKDNPLTARVAVNHIWLRHFGKAIVPSEFDFGKNGTPPSHPELLDYLAAEFMDHDWSMKHLHRLLVTSGAYRMDSSPSPTGLARDPDNKYLWRMNARRMEGEIVRDSLLHVAGQLDETMGGPDIDHNLGLNSPRRSLYFQHAAEKQMEFLSLFDAPSVNECYRRTESISPQQALALANSSLALAMSRRLARELEGKAGTPFDPALFIRTAFERVLGRTPTSGEVGACQEFLTEQAALLADRGKLTPVGGPGGIIAPSADPRSRAREGLIHVLLNHHEFVTSR